jgi:hypothetical protein
VVRRPSRTRCWWIDDSASSAGMATCVSLTARSLMIRMLWPLRMRVHRFGVQRGQLGFDALVAPGQRVGDVQRVAAELAVRVLLDLAQLLHVGEVEDRLAHFQPHRRVDLVDVQQVRLGADEGHQRHHDRFADRVDRRVGHLREQLLEVVVQRLVLVGQHGQRAVVAHRADALLAGLRHRRHQELDVFLGVAEGLLAVQQFDVAGGASPAVSDRSSSLMRRFSIHCL